MSTVQKSYIYKVYRDGTYLGNLPNVSSDFSYTLGINTAGTTLSITCNISPDVSANDLPYLTTEDGKILTTESGLLITANHPTEIMVTGNTPGTFLFRNGNKVKVYEVSKNNVNGKVVFRGTIERIEADFGGDSDQLSNDEQIQLLVYSDGLDLNNYVVPGSTALFPDQTQSTADIADDNWSGSGNSSTAGVFIWSGQSFQTGVGVTNLAAVKVKANIWNTNPFTMEIYNTPSDALPFSGVTPLGSTTLTLNGSGDNTTVNDYTFIFPTPLAVLPITNYCFVIKPASTANTADDTASFVDGGSDLYANGTAFNVVKLALYPTGAILPFLTASSAADDLYFTTYSSNYSVDATFTAQDPSIILESIVNTYASSGGLINYSAGTVDLTGISTTYTFSLSTIYNAIQTCLALAPFGFYWYVDVGTNVLYFKNASNVAEVTLIKGVHISGLSLVMTTENIVNLEYFSGGNSGSGPNLFKSYSNSTSVSNYGVRLGLESDNRVTLSSTADTLGDAFIAENKDEQQQTQVTLLDSSIDTTTLKPGMNVGFGGFGTFIDYLVLQIVEIIYEPEQVTLSLGRIPPRMHNTLQAAANAIAALQTIDNPSAPS